MRDGLRPQGQLEILVTRGVPRIIRGKLLYPGIYDSARLDLTGVQVLSKTTRKNIIVNIGKDTVISGLTVGLSRTIARMAMGDQGATPSDQTIPKVPVATATGLYHEVYRADIDIVTLNVGTPSVHQVQFTKTFSAAAIPITSFANQANPIVNEIGLVTADLVHGAALPRAAVSAPTTPPVDEALFSTVTFNSVPFVAANLIAITIRYAIFIN